MHPTARRHDTIIQDLGDETMVFDSMRDEYHLLNPLAAFIYQRADGQTALGDLVTLAHERFGGTVGVVDVEVALDELQRVHLLDQPNAEDAPRPGMSRRDAARRMAALALSVPFITSIVAPEPAMAASGKPFRTFGNNGVGNGIEPPPPGIGNAGNDAAGQTPGNPGGSTTAPGQNGGNPNAGGVGPSGKKGK